MNASLFHKAVADGDATKVKFLINIGQQARVNQPNKQGFTALQQSCNDGRIDVVHVLLNHGADINATGRKERTALHLAATGGYADIVELLIKSFADLTVKNGEGMLPEDVAKTKEIANRLSAARAEQKAKSGQSNRKKSVNSSEEWSQNFTSLPAGSRNSMVSNSSSDSGVFTEESVTSCRGGVSSDSRLSAPSWRNGSNRGGSAGDTRAAMEVLNELEEGHEQRSSSFTAAHTTTTTEKPRPKLRRSNSERLPSRRARRSTQAARRNNISEELSALDLSRVASSRDAVDGTTAARRCLSSNASKNVGRNEPSSCGGTSIDSPNNDLGICVEARDVDSARVSTQKYRTYEARSQPRSVADTVVCYAGGDEGCVVDEPDESLAMTGGRTLREIPEQPVREIELRRGWDDAELYRRSLSRKTRSGSRRRTIEVGKISHENQGPPANPHDNYSSYNDNNNNNQGILSRKHGSFRGVRMNAREAEPNPNCSADIASLNHKSCNTITAYAEPDTETEQFYRSRQELNRLKQLHYPAGKCYEDYNENADYGDSANVYRDSCNNIPGYEETLSRLRYGSERARRPASRQVSHV